MRYGWIIAGVVSLGLVLLIANHDQGSFLGMENENFARLIYLSIFGVWILAGILPKRGEIRAFVQNASIWAVIILLLMAGYVYRYELQDFGSRITGGLIAGSPISTEAADGKQRVTIFRSDNGHFMINGDVDGARIRFLVDTGASRVVLTATDAKRAGIEVDKLNFSLPIATANGSTTAAQTRVDSLTIGNIARRDVSVMVAQPGNLSESLLGMSFIDTLWGFEIRGDRMIFTDNR